MVKRIIPCLDVNNGRVVKGVNFVSLKDAGDPVEIAAAYVAAGADELVFLDITATSEGRGTVLDMVRKVAEKVTIPFTVGGGIKTLEDIERVLDAGADKVGINSAAIKNPNIIREAAAKFGSERIIAAIDAKEDPTNNYYNVYINGGQEDSGIDAVAWAIKVEEMGASEILLTSIDRDGTKAGYNLKLLKTIAECVYIPIIASGGAGTLEHFYEALTDGRASAALAASLFHFNELSIGEVKNHLKAKGVLVR
ncbi:MAG: imidazole glycerol phosphate synthase subunit HisF [Lachnospiraceae bacterium]|nr:imidazole glycerol phosphate synthase subunit HisF [Lachnospiraceae bacterium]